jgi:hypothetical protein
VTPLRRKPATSTLEGLHDEHATVIQRLQRAVPRRQQAPRPRPTNHHSAKVLTSSKRRLRSAWRGGTGR